MRWHQGETTGRVGAKAAPSLICFDLSLLSRQAVHGAYGEGFKALASEFFPSPPASYSNVWLYKCLGSSVTHSLCKQTPLMHNDPFSEGAERFMWAEKWLAESHSYTAHRTPSTPCHWKQRVCTFSLPLMVMRDGNFKHHPLRNYKIETSPQTSRWERGGASSAILSQGWHMRVTYIWVDRPMTRTFQADIQLGAFPSSSCNVLITIVKILLVLKVKSCLISNFS